MAYKKYTKEQYDKVIEYKNQGYKMFEIVKLIDVPYFTIQNWFKGVGEKQYSDEYINQKIQDEEGYKINNKQDFLNFIKVFNELEEPECIALYSYLFGLYLGDGNIYDFGRTERISYALDIKYTKLNDFSINCMTKFFGVRPSVLDRTNYTHSSNSIMLQTCSKYLDVIFPQHGHGLKNSRKIELKQWQKDILNPIEFFRGFIYSDGCYVVANGFNSNRYEFVNTSNDIIEIYKENLEKINIRFNFNTNKTLSESPLIKGKVLASNVNVAWQDDVMWLLKRIGNKEFVNNNLNIANEFGYYETNLEFLKEVFDSFEDARKELWICKTCGKNTFLNDYDSFMLNDKLWLRLNKQRKNGVICLDCVESKLGRKILKDDLKEHQLNKLNPLFK